jgi:hypothetical protein
MIKSRSSSKSHQLLRLTTVLAAPCSQTRGGSPSSTAGAAERVVVLLTVTVFVSLAYVSEIIVCDELAWLIIIDPGVPFGADAICDGESAEGEPASFPPR